MAIRTGRITELSKHCQYKMILNGTPVSKNEADMFAQWYILDWRILGYRSYWSFAANHLEYKEIKSAAGKKIRTNQVVRVLNVDYLTEKIAPYTYQVKKDECLQLPAKKYYRYYYNLTDEQQDLYAFIRWQFLMEVDEIRSETIYKLFCALQHVVSGRTVLSDPQVPMITRPMFENYRDNPRIQRLEELIEDDINDEKCIIFAKYQSEIDDIGKLLASMGKTWTMFTGRIPQKQRQENRRAFRENVQFLVANKACGAYGLNLQFCHTIIYYSNDFDLATRMQSEDRVHRIGQDHPVRIYDIYCPGTIDEFIIKCLDKKENMVEAFKREIQKWRDELMKLKYSRISSGENEDFYARMGPFFASRAVRKDFDGYPLSNEDDWTWVIAEYKKEIVGFLGLEPVKNGEHIHAVYVAPDYRKNGIMRDMISKIEDGKTVTVTTRQELRKAYEQAGFIVTGVKGKNWLNMRREASEKAVS